MKLLFSRLLLVSLCIVASIHAAPLRDAAALASVQKEFPVLARLLSADTPWEQEPAALANALFARPPKLTQGNAAYPLLFADQREASGWPGEKVGDQLAYETEFYVFDREHPLIRLHVGRPLVFAMQHGRVEAVAAGRRGAAQFPPLSAAAIPPLLAQLDAVASSLAPFGAQRVLTDHPLVTAWELPNGVTMTVTNYTGSTNGTPYVEIALTPTKPVARFAGTQTLAFPGAEGAGRYARGGRGGRVFVVTSLEDYLPRGRPGRPEGTYGQASSHALTLGEGKWRPFVDALGQPRPGEGQPLLPGFPALPREKVIHGTLREAVEAEGPRTIVFAVSGDIALKSDLVIRNPYLTIAGQSAPGEGVQIRNWGVRVETHDVILRHLRIRVGEVKGPGDTRRVLGEQTHALDLSGINIIVDHCEVAYANDQMFNTYGTVRREGITLQWSYLYGAPTRSTHEKGAHSMTTVGVGWGFVSLHHNLIAHSRVRNPRLDMLNYDFRNNVLYNFSGTGYGSDNDPRRLNYVGNTIVKGPEPTGAKFAFVSTGPFAQLYGADNALPADFKGVFDAPKETIVARPLPASPVTTHAPAEAFEIVLAQGGATKPARDAITTYVADTVRTRTGFVPGTPDDWPGGGFARYAPAPAPADTNRNGIPDAWEIARGLNLAKTKSGGHDLDPRYDNLEIYLNSL